MFIRREQPVLLNQHVWNNHSLTGDQRQPHLDAFFHQANKDSNHANASALGFQIQLHKDPQTHERRRTKVRYRNPRLNQLTQQDIIAWAQGLSHPAQVQGCQPLLQQTQGQQYTQLNQIQRPLHQQAFIKMEHKNFPYVDGSDENYWQVGDPYGSDFITDMSAYSNLGVGQHQTTGGYIVSGREPDPGQSQDNHQHVDKGAMGSSISQQMMWPTFHAGYRDKYSPPPFAPIETECPRQQSMPAIFGDPSSTNYMGLSMHHGLPSKGWATDSPMPMLGESMLYDDQIGTPNQNYTSFSSSSASEAMAHMSLDAPMGNHGVDSTDMTMAGHSTVSPKVLRTNPSPAPVYSSDSAITAFFPHGDGDLSSASSLEQYPPPVQSKRSNARGRKALPDRPQASHYTPAQSESYISLGASDNLVDTHHLKHKAHPTPKPARTSPSESTSPEDHVLAAERNKQNEFLIQSKMRGMTYRDIKREGGFKEAESTLRGRYRTLTKPKVSRVRKPEWTNRDIELLKKGVDRLSKGNDAASNKIPWKQVSAYIAKNGGSYNFGYATCARRWEELLAQENYC